MAEQALDYESQYEGFKESEKELCEQSFLAGYLRGFADGEAKQKVLEKKARERSVNDLRASWRQPAL
jgi:hypothetical protein